MINKARKVAATSVLAAAGVLVLGAFGSTAWAAESASTVAPVAVAGAAQLDPGCDCLPGPAPRPEKPAPAPGQPAPTDPGAGSGPGAPGTPSTPLTGDATCPAIVPSHPTGADYVNAWNQSGMCFGAGAAGLVSSAWAGAIPSIVQGAAGSVGSAKTDEAGGLTAPVVVPSHPTGADYVNAWNQSGALAGAGAAGLVSSAWAGAIPSIVQGAAGSMSTPAKADTVRPAHKHATAKSHESAAAPKATKSTSKSTKDRSARDSEGLTAPVVVPSHPTGADYVNAWNKAGALAGAGAAGLVSSAWAGAIPSIVQGAAGSLG
ncbi:MAG TPA: hypothetical protein VJ870_05940 [Amycolatopsis sp.]|nr:hypothetical protein [Amycolatopsis sp.]